jgi:uncharacterized protein (TIGR03435 family)
MRYAITATAFAALLLSLTSIVVAQNQPLKFEAVSVKPTMITGGQRGNSGAAGGGVYDLQGHRFIARESTLYALIKWGYGVSATSVCVFFECDFLTGGPSWVRSDKFDVQAVMPDESPIYTFRQMADGRAPVLQAMLQTLLVERFKLVVHSDMKEMPVYVLTVAKGGPKLTPSKDDDKRTLLVSGDPTGKILDRTLRATKASMASLVYLLGLPQVTDRPVLDRTGITGEFNFEVKFAPVDNNAFGNTSSSSIFTALQEQLGLKLEAAKAPLEVFVIDSAEKPTEN